MAVGFIDRERMREERRACQGALYDGLYDGVGITPIAVPGGVQILNPLCGENDATSRRFAQLEIE
jgi:hypothetical protein